MSPDLSALFAKAKKVTLITAKTEDVPEPKQDQSDLVEKPKKKAKRSSEVEDSTIVNGQTIFVGNVPSGCTQKELKRLFSQFGTVESVRLRNLIPLNPKRGKRLAFIKKEFHPLQKTITAFIRFIDSTEAQSATHLNGFLYKDHHLRVDLAHDQQNETKHDHKRSIFIGNLPFDVNDDDVWKIFEECGEIEGVRIIRDGATSIGKGFGYVLFKDEASVTLALSMNGNCKLANREIRIKAAMKKPKTNTIRSVPQNTFDNKPKKTKFIKRKDSAVDIQQGRVEKRPTVKLKKESQKKKKKQSITRTNNIKNDVIQLKKKS